VLFVVPSLGGGGAEMQVLRVVNHLDCEKLASLVAVMRSGGAYEVDLRSDVRLVRLLPQWIRSSTLSLVAATFPLRGLLRRERPDVLVSLLPHTAGLCTLALAGISPRPRIVAGIQNNVSRDLASGGNPVKRWFDRLSPRFYRKADRVIALSQGVADDLVRHFPDLRAKIETIYNAGVDERVRRLAAEPMTEPRPANAGLIVACGRLSEQKDFPTLLRAMARVKNPAELWILGCGPDEAALRQLASELGIAGHVRFLGFRSNPFQYMAAADVFVLSSRWEGFGNVIVEAMASGAAVISTRCDFGPAEIIEQGRNGLLCAVGDDVDMATQIDRVLADDGLRTNLKQAGRLRASDFDATSIAAAYGRVLTSV
jgi:glycosyltransferase involved in cell wall biosynthesis